MSRRFGVLLGLALLLPMLGFALLLVEPRLDVVWEHHPSHFWLVTVGSGLNAVLAYATSAAARQRNDARVFLVSLAFLSSAGFQALHALATPGVLLDGPNSGFALATPVGLLIAGGFAAASSAPLLPAHAAAVMHRARLLRGLLVGAMAVWAAVSVAGIPPLDHPEPPVPGSAALVGLGVAGFLLYAVAVVRYLRLPRHPGSATLLVAMTSAFVLLAEAEVAVAFGRNWHATWWEWHVLQFAAFAVIAISAHRQWHEERFAGLYLQDTATGTREISVLFADLQGFTTFSEQHPPQEVTAMLNEYFTVAVPPVVEKYGGQIDRIVGDALMATFNTRGDQPDHALLAARAGLAIQQITAEVAAQHPGWPLFRVGVNTGDATVGILGTRGGRTFTAIGDAVNLAARLEGKAPVGGVVIGAETARRLPDARTESLGLVQVKGKADAVEVFHLLDA